MKATGDGTRAPSAGPGRGPGRGGDRRGYSREPFRDGNTVALRHGARSERMIAPLAERARARVVEAVSWLASPAFSATLDAWARAEARIALLSAYVGEHGVLDDDGRPRPAAELLERVERRAADLRGRLGLDPVSHAKIARDLAVASRDLDLVVDPDLSRAIAEGRRLRGAS